MQSHTSFVHPYTDLLRPFLNVCHVLPSKTLAYRLSPHRVEIPSSLTYRGCLHVSLRCIPGPFRGHAAHLHRDEVATAYGPSGRVVKSLPQQFLLMVVRVKQQQLAHVRPS